MPGLELNKTWMALENNAPVLGLYDSNVGPDVRLNHGPGVNRKQVAFSSGRVIPVGHQDAHVGLRRLVCVGMRKQRVASQETRNHFVLGP